MQRVAGRIGLQLIRPAAVVMMVCGIVAPSIGAEVGKERAVNPVVWFEVPVTDMDRAIGFYQSVLGIRFTREKIDGYDMALFARIDGAAGASGALAKGDVYVPSLAGPILYFDVPDIDPVLDRATAAGAAILLPKKMIAPGIHVAEIRDSEGNRIGLTSTSD